MIITKLQLLSVDFKSPFTYSFHSSRVLFDLPQHPLYPRIDWIAKGNRRALVDPFDSNAILYADESRYFELVKVFTSADKVVTVLAGENSVAPINSGNAVKDPSGSSTNSYNTPQLKYLFFDGLSPSEKRSTEKFLKSSLIDLPKELSHLRGESTVTATKELLSPLIREWGNILFLWTKGRVLQPGESILLAQYARHLTFICAHNGAPYLIKRMKALYILLLAFYFSDHRTSSDGLGSFISLTKDGLPKEFPKEWRAQIRSRDIDFARFLLSLLYSFKGLTVPTTKYDLSTITDESIATAPCLPSLCQEIVKWNASLNQTFKFRRDSKGFFPDLAPGYVKPSDQILQGGYRKPDLSSSLDYSPSVKAGPNSKFAIRGLIDDLRAWYHFGIHPVLDYISVTRASSFWFLLKHISQEGTGVSSSKTSNLGLGKLSLKFEAAGKVRVFAIVDQVSQWLLKPLHTALFQRLKTLESDSTFDQLVGVDRISTLVGSFRASLDLSAATDRVPIELYEAILDQVASPAFSKAWRSLLVDRDFRGPRGESVRYRVGQPMGAYSSWALLAVAHHYIVKYAALRAGKGPNSFWDYQILGDDIVIACPLVAKAYQELCTELGIGISRPKSFVSETGGFQFASEVKVGGTYLSPASLKEELSIFSLSSRINSSLALLKRWGMDQYSGPIIPFLRRCSSPTQWKLGRADLKLGLVWLPYWRLLVTLSLGPSRNAFSIPRKQGDGIRIWLESFAPTVNFIRRASQVICIPSGRPESVEGRGPSDTITLLDPVVRSLFNIAFCDWHRVGSSTTWSNFQWKRSLRSSVSPAESFTRLLLPMLESKALRDKFVELHRNLTKLDRLWNHWEILSEYPEELRVPFTNETIFEFFDELLDLASNPVIVPVVSSPEARAAKADRALYLDSPFDKLIFKVGAAIRPRLRGEPLNLPKVCLDPSAVAASWFTGENKYSPLPENRTMAGLTAPSTRDPMSMSNTRLEEGK